MMRHPALSSLLLAAACSDLASYEQTDAGGTLTGDATSAVDTGNSTTATGTDDTGGAAYPDAAYYGLDAQLDVVLGAIEPTSSTLQVSLWSTDVDTICVHDVAITAATTEPLTPDPSVYAWWRLDLDDGVTSGSCQPWPSRTLWIGVGAYDARLDPALAEHGWLDTSVYGLYVQEYEAGPLYVMGIAGTPDLLAGTGSPVTAAPLPDDRYEAHSLILMSMP